jgi:hypothetical protein
MIRGIFTILIGLFVIGWIFGGDSSTENKQASNTETQTEVVKEEPKLTAEQEWSKLFVEGDTQTKVTMVAKKHESTAASLCKAVGKMGAKFPNKIDWDWGYDAKRVYWTDGTDVDAGQMTITRLGEAMNGFGMMLPFQIQCKYAVNLRGADIHLTTVKWISGDQSTTLLDLPAPDVDKYTGKIFTPVSYNQ